MIALAFADMDSRVATLTGAETLTVQSKRVQKLDPGGAHRNLVLPHKALCKGYLFWIINTADAAENLVVLDEDGNTIVTIGQSQNTLVGCDGLGWTGLPVTWSNTGTVLVSPTITTPTITNPTITRTPGASTAAAGNATGNAGVLPAATSSVYPTTAADDTKGVRLHADDTVTGRMIFIGNGVSNKILKVYPPTGGTINGAAADAAFSSASGKGVIVYCSDSATNAWLAW